MLLRLSPRDCNNTFELEFFMLYLEYVSRGGCLHLTLAITIKVGKWSLMSHLYILLKTVFFGSLQ